MVRVYVEQLTRYFKASLEKLFPTKGFFTSLFSSKSENLKEPSDIELAILPMLEYFDEIFGLFNRNLDPELGSVMIKLNPWLKSVVEKSPKTKEAPTKDDEMVSEPNILMKLIWESYLKEVSVHLLMLLSSSAAGSKNKGLENVALSKEQKEQVEVIEIVLEMLKSLFYCDEGSGISLKELEGTRYREFRDTLKLFRKASVAA